LKRSKDRRVTPRVTEASLPRHDRVEWSSVARI